MTYRFSDSPSGRERHWERRRRRGRPSAPWFIRPLIILLAFALIVVVTWRGIQYALHTRPGSARANAAAYESAPSRQPRRHKSRHQHHSRLAARCDRRARRSPAPRLGRRRHRDKYRPRSRRIHRDCGAPPLAAHTARFFRRRAYQARPGSRRLSHQLAAHRARHRRAHRARGTALLDRADSARHSVVGQPRRIARRHRDGRDGAAVERCAHIQHGVNTRGAAERRVVIRAVIRAVRREAARIGIVQFGACDQFQIRE